MDTFTFFIFILLLTLSLLLMWLMFNWISNCMNFSAHLFPVHLEDEMEEEEVKEIEKIKWWCCCSFFFSWNTCKSASLTSAKKERSCVSLMMKLIYLWTRFTCHLALDPFRLHFFPPWVISDQMRDKKKKREEEKKTLITIVDGGKKLLF